MRRFARLAVCIVVLHASARVGGAQAVPTGTDAPQVVSRVEFVLDGRPLSDPDLLTLVDVQRGRPLDAAEVRESIQHLVHLRRFATIDVLRETTPTGLVVRFQLTPLQRIASYRIAGDLKVPGRDLERAIRDRIGSVPTAELVPDALSAVQEALGERGYLQPDLSHRFQPLDAEGNVRLVIEGRAGPRWVLGRIVVTGMDGDVQATGDAVLGLSPGDPYDRLVLQQREQRFVARQRAAGYYEAMVRTTPSPGATQTVDLRVEVDRGPRVALSFEGDRLPADVRRDLVPVEAEGSVDEDLLEDSRARIVAWLRERGHWRAEVEYAREVVDGGLDIVFTVRAGRLYDTGEIVIGGQRALTTSDIRALVGLRTGQPFSPSLLDQSEGAIVRAYRDRGFPAARVERALVDVSEPSLAPDSRGTVEVRLRVVEGTEARVHSVTIDGVSALPLESLREAMTVRAGALFSSAAVVADRDVLLRRYLDDGYRQAQVETDLAGADDGRTIAVTYRVAEGPQVLVDRVVVVGNVRVSDETIRRELQVASGQPLGLSRVFDTQRRLTALGLFRSIRISDVPQPGTNLHDVIVTVEEAPVTTIGYGVGLEGGQRLRATPADTDPRQPGAPPEAAVVGTRFELAPRGFFEVGRRNFLGKNRSVNLFLRGSLRPRDVPGDPERDGTGLALSEYRVLSTWREPRAFFESTNLDVSAFVEQAIRSSFNFRRQAARAEMSRQVRQSMTVIGRYGFGRTELFDARVAPEDQLSVDRLFPQVRLSSVSSSLLLDTRDDPLDPQRGAFASIDGELAGRSIGSEVGFNKTYMQGFLYRRLPGGRVVLAGGARLGLARGLPRGVTRLGDDAQPLVGPEGDPLVDVVRDLPASERFFAGGDSTVRGFALDRLGAPATLDRNGLPTGGNAVVVFNSEVRFPVWKSIGAAAFIDAGNVFLRVSDLDLRDIRGATGFGLRYRSPIGPIRVDLGFKLSRRTFINGTREGRTALHITVGQAF